LAEFGRFNLNVPNSQWRPWSEHKGTLVIKDGWLVGEWYEGEESQIFPQYLASNGNAVSLACFGIATGLVEGVSLDSCLYDPRWLPQGFPLSDPRKDRITFDQVFRHTSGLCPEIEEAGRYQTDKNYTRWVVGQDPRYPETASLYYAPGHPEQYSRSGTRLMATYSSVAFQHIGLFLANISGQPAHQFLEQRLLAPIGIQRVEYFQPVEEWSAGAENAGLRWHSEGGLRLAPRDYARLAYLLLQDGNWDGHPLLPPGWVNRFRDCSDYPNLCGNRDGVFGREYPPDLFRIAGAGANWAFMAPSLNLLAVRTGRSEDNLAQETEREFLRLLFQALR
jgi:CubicO group peptidase (beta-lactamase class C family)